MSDHINAIGGPGQRVRPQQIGAKTPSNGAGAPPVSQTGTSAAAGPVEAFSPSNEAAETQQEQKAGEATASKILGAWTIPSANASAGQLNVQGGENTAVNQIHGTKDGAYSTSQGAKPGFTGGTVYSTRPPLG